MIGKLDFDLIEITQSIVQNGLLSLGLALSLTLTLTHLLLLCTLGLPLSKRHEQCRRVACVLGLGRLDRTSSKHVVGTLRTAEWELSLRLWPSQTGISKQAVWAMDSTWTYGNRLMQMHRLTLSLVLWSLFQPLTLLLTMLPVLLFFDVDLLALTVCSLGLASGLTECRQREVRSLRTFRSVYRWRRLAWRRLVHTTKTVRRLLLVTKVAAGRREARMASRGRLLRRMLGTVQVSVSGGLRCVSAGWRAVVGGMSWEPHIGHSRFGSRRAWMRRYILLDREDGKEETYPNEAPGLCDWPCSAPEPCALPGCAHPR